LNPTSKCGTNKIEAKTFTFDEIRKLSKSFIGLLKKLKCTFSFYKKKNTELYCILTNWNIKY